MTITLTEQEHVLHIARMNPDELGLGFGTWSMRKLSTYLTQQGVKLSYASIWKVLTREGIKFREPTHRRKSPIKTIQAGLVVEKPDPVLAVSHEPSVIEQKTETQPQPAILDIVFEQHPKIITIRSPIAACVLTYLRKTVPEFSVPAEARRVLEAGLKEKYPEIWELYENHGGKK